MGEARESRRIVGTDGELLQPDLTADVADYEAAVGYAAEALEAPSQSYAASELPPRNMSRRASGYALLLLMSVSVVLCIVSFAAQTPAIGEREAAIRATSQIPRITDALDFVREPSNQSTRWGDVRQVAWRPGGQMIAIADSQHLVWLWHSQMDQERRMTTARAMAWSPDGSQLALVTDTEVQVWNAADLQTELVIPLANAASIIDMRWAADGRYLAAYAADQSLVILDVQDSGRRVAHNILSSPLTMMSWIRSDRLYVLIQHEVWTWSPHNGWDPVIQVTDEDRRWVSLLGLARDRYPRLLAAREANTTVRLDVLEYRSSVFYPMNSFTLPLPVNGQLRVVLSPNQQQMALYFAGSPTNIQIRDVKSVALNAMLYTETYGTINSLDWSPDGHYLAIGGEDGITLWAVPQ